MLEIVRRWMEIDKALGSLDGLHIPSIAKRLKVSEKTIRRDLEVFEAIINSQLDRGLDANGYRHVWYYPGPGAIFTDNLDSRLRKAMREIASKK